MAKNNHQAIMNKDPQNILEKIFGGDES